MNIPIKLADPKYCDGCPCLHTEWENCQYYAIALFNKFKGRFIRPQKCIEENG